MRILHAISGAASSGTESAFEQTVVALSRRDVPQRVLLPTGSSLNTRIKDAGLEPQDVPFRTRFDFSSKRRLNNEIGVFEPDVIISWTPDVADRVMSTSAKHIGYVGRDFSASAYQSCDHLFTLSQQRVDRAVGAGWSKEKIEALPVITSAEVTKSLTRQTFFTPDTAKLVVSVGHLTHEQGLDVLIEAVARISGLYLWAVGEGPDEQALLDKALQVGIKPRTRFTGYQHDVLSAVAAADIVVCPARQDDRGEQVLQAWACGKPVIAADSIGSGLLIQHRENGVLVPIDDARSLAEAIKWVNQDKDFATRIASAGAETFARSYAADVVLPKYIEYFENVMAGSGDDAPAQ